MTSPTSLPLRSPRRMNVPARVAVLAPGSPSEPGRIEKAIERLGDRGVSVSLPANAFESCRSYLAGDDARRADEINRLLRSDDYDAFFVTRGGYGTMRVLERIDYEAIDRNPRPIIGLSDVTALHQAIAVRCGVSTFHGPMLNLDWHEGLSGDRERWFFSMLAGEPAMTHRFPPEDVVCDGTTEGIVFGGCLSLTAALVGTPYDFWIDDGIWFWEDVNEPLYRIDRMLTHLRLSGRFDSLRAVMIGTLKGCGGDGDRPRFDALLREFFGERRIPVVRDLPFGHSGDNLLIPIGARALVDTNSTSWVFPDPAVL